MEGKFSVFELRFQRFVNINCISEHHFTYFNAMHGDEIELSTVGLFISLIL